MTSRTPAGWCPSTATRTRRSRPGDQATVEAGLPPARGDRGGKLPGRPPADRGDRPGRAAAAAAGDAVREPAQPAGLAVPRRPGAHRRSAVVARAPRRRPRTRVAARVAGGAGVEAVGAQLTIRMFYSRALLRVILHAIDMSLWFS